MKILLTGSSGRIGRALFGALAAEHEVVGLDRQPFSTTRHVGDFTDASLLRRAMVGIDAIVHTASLHAPHVGIEAEAEFRRVNIEGLRRLTDLATEAGVGTIVYTSTTALYGAAVEPGRCTWVDEATLPIPITVYHRTKLEAEAWLEHVAGPCLAVRVVRMSRCFPETADRMAMYRLHRGIDARDVADAHLAALAAGGAPFQRYIASGRTPFERGDAPALACDPRSVLALRCPGLVREFDRRAWPLPAAIDRVYAATAAHDRLGWHARYGFEEVLAQNDRRSLEVLPLTAWFRDRTME